MADSRRSSVYLWLTQRPRRAGLPLSDHSPHVDDAMTVMEPSISMRRRVRTSNYLGRLNKEIKRRSKVIGIFPNVSSVIRLMGAFLMEENERWKAQRKIYYTPACEELKAKIPTSAKITRNQIELRKVA
ncbi:MAG: transposase [Atopobium sp.]|nr:transposase [Atopobium sp.]